MHHNYAVWTLVCSLYNIIDFRVSFMGNFTWMGKIKNAYNIFIWKPERKTLHGIGCKIC
jgi:hypothetical protein